MKTLQTPDVTKNQMIALATGLVAFLASMGLPLSDANQNRVFAIAIVIPTVLMIADAIIRFGRAVMAGNKYDLNDLGLDEPDED